MKPKKFWRNIPITSVKKMVIAFCKYSVTKNQSIPENNAKLRNIEKNLTFHVSRHTFANIIALLNDVSIEKVSKILGHTKLSITQKYAKVVEKKNGKNIDQ